MGQPAETGRAPDVTGTRALVTGASDGIGFALARHLAVAGADLILPVRNRAKGEYAADQIRLSAPEARVIVMDVDLASLESVARLAQLLRADGKPIHLFVGNAGVMLLRSKARQETADGFEVHFQTNFLGHFALVAGIFPVLRAGNARIVMQSSLAAARYGIDWEDLQVRNRYTPLRAYGRSKVALSLFGMELQRRSASRGWGLESTLAHPGTAVTAITFKDPDVPVTALDRMRLTLGKRVIQTPDAASGPALYAATAREDVGGRFYGPAHLMHTRGPAIPLRPYARIADAGAAARIWSVAEELAGVRIP